jgi:hypothetical protein
MSIHRRLVSRPVLAAVALLGGAGLVRPTPASADAPAGDRRFMVMPFENLSSVHQIVDYQLPDAGGKHAGKNFAQVDRFCEAPREDLEELISNSVPGVSIVERQRADSILQEQEFGGLKGVSDPDKAVAAGKLVGANTIAIGTIDQIASSVKEFHGDGIDVIDRTTTASVHIRIIDIEQGIVIAQKRFKGDNMVRLSSRGDKVDIDSEFDAVKAALDKVKDDPAFLAKIGGGAAGDAGATGPAPPTCRSTATSSATRRRRSTCRRGRSPRSPCTRPATRTGRRR